jgi:hypothetical protein
MGTSIPPEVQRDPFAHIAHAKRRAFLRALADCGKHTHACRVAQIAHSHPWYWRRVDPHFDELEQHAWALWVDQVVAAARTSVRR